MALGRGDAAGAVGRVNDPTLLPLLDVTIDSDAVRDGYRFDGPAIASLRKVRFDRAVTLFVGENGIAKSALVEAARAELRAAADQVAIDKVAASRRRSQPT